MGIVGLIITAENYPHFEAAIATKSEITTTANTSIKNLSNDEDKEELDGKYTTK
ncbi:hypothetical protein [Nostoc sp.]|uniref:hypothetical protein n=1 Tax=Nostoc sp. TaxID=1180 RepID=UPI002FF66DC1